MFYGREMYWVADFLEKEVIPPMFSLRVSFTAVRRFFASSVKGAFKVVDRPLRVEEGNPRSREEEEVEPCSCC